MKNLVDRILSNQSGVTKVTKFFQVESKTASDRVEDSEWGNNGYDFSNGKLTHITRKDLSNIWVTKGDSRFQSTVDNATVAHFYIRGVTAMKEDGSDGIKGPIRLVFFEGKFYIHDGHHRMAAAILRNDTKVKVRVWKLKLEGGTCNACGKKNVKLEPDVSGLLDWVCQSCNRPKPKRSLK